MRSSYVPVASLLLVSIALLGLTLVQAQSTPEPVKPTPDPGEITAAPISTLNMTPTLLNIPEQPGPLMSTSTPAPVKPTPDVREIDANPWLSVASQTSGGYASGVRQVTRQTETVTINFDDAYPADFDITVTDLLNGSSRYNRPIDCISRLQGGSQLGLGRQACSLYEGTVAADSVSLEAVVDIDLPPETYLMDTPAWLSLWPNYDTYGDGSIPVREHVLSATAYRNGTLVYNYTCELNVVRATCNSVTEDSLPQAAVERIQIIHRTKGAITNPNDYPLYLVAIDNIELALRQPQPTPTPTPEFPREIAPEAEDFHDRYAAYGLPLPFDRLPFSQAENFNNQFVQGYGPNDFAIGSNQYSGTHGIHPGIDYYNSVYVECDETTCVTDYAFTVYAVCSGVIISSGAGGGSAQASSGDGISLRCFAETPPDPDDDNNLNLSNIVAVYNHLQPVADDNFANSTGMTILEGMPLGRVTGYGGTDCVEPRTPGEWVQSGCVRPHLDFQVFFARGKNATNTGRFDTKRLQINPFLMFDASLIDYHDNYLEPYFPADAKDQAYGIEPGILNEWSMGGNTEDDLISGLATGEGALESDYNFTDIQTPQPLNEVEWWVEQTDDWFLPDHMQSRPALLDFIDTNFDMGNNPYYGPNCTNISIDDYQTGGDDIPGTCDLDEDDSTIDPFDDPES